MRWFDAAFGADKSGLTSVHFRFYKKDGTDASARASTGVLELNGGAYGVYATIPASAVGIEWDTGEASATYAHESLPEVSVVVSNVVSVVVSAVVSAQAMTSVQDRRLLELHQIFGLESGSPLVTTTSTRAAASITQTITGDPTSSVTVTRT